MIGCSVNSANVAERKVQVTARDLETTVVATAVTFALDIDLIGSLVADDAHEVFAGLRRKVEDAGRALRGGLRAGEPLGDLGCHFGHRDFFRLASAASDIGRASRVATLPSLSVSFALVSPGGSASILRFARRRGREACDS